MRRIREVLRLKFDLKLSDVRVALGANIARATVQDYLRRITATGLDHEQLLALDDKALDEKLFPPLESRNTARPLPDWEAIEQQLRGRGVTLRLLWQEYQVRTHLRSGAATSGGAPRVGPGGSHQPARSLRSADSR